MAFKEVSDLSTETTVSLGGINKKTGKANPKQIEGYFIGKKEVEDKKKKSGKSFIYVIQTPKGNVGVWGKTDLDRKMLAVTEGHMVRITQNKMVPTPNGEMYGYKVEQDSENSIQVSMPAPKAVSASVEAIADEEEVSSFSYEPEGEEEALDEVAYAPPVAPRRPTVSPDAARVQALLNKARKQSA